jgi:DNA ligase 1
MKGRRETTMLAHTYDSRKHDFLIDRGWMVSTKLDGLRCIWDGGVSRGIRARDVPWANVEKHARLREEVFCTGLWTRLYQPIQAPSWFLDQLAEIRYPLDGELYLGPGSFEKTVSICKRYNPDERWREVRYCVFDAPPLCELLREGRINVPLMKDKVIGEECLTWARERTNVEERPLKFYYCDVYEEILKKIVGVEIVVQERINDLDQIYNRLDSVVNAGGEGLILRNPMSKWVAQRSWDLLKMKRDRDADGIVVGYMFGREGKILGLMGAMVVYSEELGVTFELSGFTDRERELVDSRTGERGRIERGIENPGEKVPDWISNPMFPRGSRVSFRYADLSEAGVPRFARYWRKAPC